MISDFEAKPSVSLGFMLKPVSRVCFEIGKAFRGEDTATAYRTSDLNLHLISSDYDFAKL